MSEGVAQRFIKGFAYVLSANMVNLVLGVLKTLALPLLLGVTNFGYWQVYALYLSYVWILGLGFAEGTYLRYGGTDYGDLPFPRMRGSIRLLLALQVAFAVIAGSLAFLEPDPSKRAALLLVALNVPISVLLALLMSLLQSTHQFRIYGTLSVVDKCLMSAFIGVLLFLHTDRPEVVMLADTAFRLVALVLAGYSMRALLHGRACGLREAAQEFRENVSAGSSLAISFLAGMLMVGLGRFVLERFGSIESFGSYSLAISTLSLVLVFSMALGTVLFPTLSRLEPEGHVRRFEAMRGSASVVGVLVIGTYFPVHWIIHSFLVEFRSVLEYLGALFCLVYLQIRTQVALDPFFKLIRRERALMAFNLIGLGLTAALVSWAYWWQGTPLAVAVATLVGVGVRTYLAEVYIARRVGGAPAWVPLALEISGVGLFAWVSTAGPDALQVAVYVALVGSLAVLHRRSLGQILGSLRSGFRR